MPIEAAATARDTVANAAKNAAKIAGAKIKKAVTDAHEVGYFEPICTERHLSVRHFNTDAASYVGDVTHLLALFVCIAVVLRESGTDGVSFKTHVLFFMVFTARFFNIFFCDQPIYLILYKVLLWTITLKIVFFMWVLGSSEDTRDTLPLSFVLVPTFIVTFVFGVYSVQDQGLFVEFSWIFSMYLESVAMLPQYIYCYRDADNTSPLVSTYVVAMGFYRMVFGLSWAYHFYMMPYYLDVSALISGVLGIVFFCDYLLFKVARKSTLSHVCISVDDGLREAEEVARDLVNGEHNPSLPTAGVPPDKIGRPAEVEMSAEVVIHHRD